jgi:hypothetical protein
MFNNPLGYQRKTIPARKSNYQINIRVDQKTHSKFKHIEDSYQKAFGDGKKVKRSLVLRRAIYLLSDYLGSNLLKNPDREKATLRQIAEG